MFFSVIIYNSFLKNEIKTHKNKKRGLVCIYRFK